MTLAIVATSLNQIVTEPLSNVKTVSTFRFYLDEIGWKRQSPFCYQVTCSSWFLFLSQIMLYWYMCIYRRPLVDIVIMTGAKEHRLSVKMEDMKAPQLLNPVSFKVLDGTKYTLNTFLLRRLWLQMTKAQDGRFPIQDIVALTGGNGHVSSMLRYSLRTGRTNFSFQCFLLFMTVPQLKFWP